MLKSSSVIWRDLLIYECKIRSMNLAVCDPTLHSNLLLKETSCSYYTVKCSCSNASTSWNCKCRIHLPTKLDGWSSNVSQPSILGSTYCRSLLEKWLQQLRFEDLILEFNDPNTCWWTLKIQSYLKKFLQELWKVS